MNLALLWERWNPSIVPIVLSLKATCFPYREEGWEAHAFHLLLLNGEKEALSYCAIGKLGELFPYFSPNKHEDELSQTDFSVSSSVLATRFCIAPHLRGSGFHRYFATLTVFQILLRFSPFITIHSFVQPASKLFPYLRKLGFRIWKSNYPFQFAVEERVGYWLIYEPLKCFHVLVKEHLQNGERVAQLGFQECENTLSLPEFQPLLPSSYEKPTTLFQLFNVLTENIREWKASNPEWLHQLAYQYDLPEIAYYHAFFHGKEEDLALLFLSRELLRRITKVSLKSHEG